MGVKETKWYNHQTSALCMQILCPCRVEISAQPLYLVVAIQENTVDDKVYSERFLIKKSVFNLCLEKKYIFGDYNYVNMINP